MIEDVLEDTFNLEIARELILAEDSNADNDTVERIWSMCNGNPWNAPVLYNILKVSGGLE